MDRSGKSECRRDLNCTKASRERTGREPEFRKKERALRRPLFVSTGRDKLIRTSVPAPESFVIEETSISSCRWF